jgi:hypothetical protein
MNKPSSEIHPIAMRKHYLDSQAAYYAFNFMTPLQQISSRTNFKLQLKEVAKK